jgi:phosphoglycolate phosphatase
MTLIALDLDGTLEDSRSDMAAAVRRVRARFGLPQRGEEAILPWVNRGMDALYRACFDDYLLNDPARLAEVREAYERDYLANLAVTTRLYPGIGPALSDLAGLGSLAVVTNKPERISRRLLDLLGVGGYFTAVVGGDTCAKGKPDPEVLDEAARLCGIEPRGGRSVMIGDSAADIRMGRAFGAATIWCAWGYANEPGESPDLIVERPSDLPGQVRKVLASIVA